MTRDDRKEKKEREEKVSGEICSIEAIVLFTHHHRGRFNARLRLTIGTPKIYIRAREKGRERARARARVQGCSAMGIVIAN